MPASDTDKSTHNRVAFRSIMVPAVGAILCTIGASILMDIPLEQAMGAGLIALGIGTVLTK